MSRTAQSKKRRPPRRALTGAGATPTEAGAPIEAPVSAGSAPRPGGTSPFHAGAGGSSVVGSSSRLDKSGTPSAVAVVALTKSACRRIGGGAWSQEDVGGTGATTPEDAGRLTSATGAGVDEVATEEGGAGREGVGAAGIVDTEAGAEGVGSPTGCTSKMAWQMVFKQRMRLPRRAGSS
jgi:hypothetical protein